MLFNSNRHEWINKICTQITYVGKLESPCEQTRVQSRHTANIVDLQSTHLASNELLNMKQFDPTNLSQTTTSTTIVANAQKEEWFV